MSRTPNYGTVGNSENGSGLPNVGFPTSEFSPTIQFEMVTLRENVTSSITEINLGWKTLDKNIKAIGTSKDSKALRDSIMATRQNISMKIGSTIKDLERLNIVVKRGDKKHKLQVERLAETFSETLKKYSSIETQLNEKMHKFMLKTPMTDFSTPDVEDSDDTVRLMAQKQAQAQKLQFEASLLEEQEENMRKIEESVLYVNQMIKDLRFEIHQQGTVIDTIEHNIESGAAHVESGEEELAKANRLASKFRRKIFIMIAIAVILGIILTIIIVNSLKR